MTRSFSGVVIAALIFIASHQTGSAQQAPARSIKATTAADLRTWDTYISASERAGTLRVRGAVRDPALPSRTLERLQQFHNGVPIWGAEVVRDSDRGVVVSMFGELSPDLTLSTQAALSVDDAGARIRRDAGDGATLLRAPELTILRQSSGEHRLVYTAVVATQGRVTRVFVDAGTGTEVLRHSALLTQSAVGVGRGVLGDQKKMSVLPQAGTFFADDQLRPPVLRTFDLRGNLIRGLNVVFFGAPVAASERASDSDNNWTDSGVVDAHAHVGWTYDYYFKRFGRHGLDDRDRPITNVVNVVTPSAALTLPNDLFELAVNAFWCGECGSGIMYFGSGYPAGAVDNTGQHVAPLSGALDITAHELTHGVVDSTSQLAFGNESGALNEAIADIMGTSVEFFYQQPGTGLGRADYVVGEDSFQAAVPGVLSGLRSLADPLLFGYPDHYSQRFTGTDDDGGVHINAGIPGNAFYLAVEGGTNRTSGLSVQGVGAANREQMERVFYRAFIFLLPADATFSTARAATIQAARDLFGVGSAAERAVTQAWTAVGVF